MRRWSTKIRHCFPIIITMLLIITMAYAESTDEWNVPPIITEAYEQTTEKLYIEWEGKASTYLVYVDGTERLSVDVPSALIGLQKGSHTIKILPAQRIESSDINVEIAGIASIGVNRGLIAPEVMKGTASKALTIDYIPDPLFNVNVSAPEAMVGLDDIPRLSFADRYGADEYLVTIKSGNDTSYIRYYAQNGVSDNVVSYEGENAVLLLDPEYLKANGCLPLRMGKQYAFTVQLRKYATSMLTAQKISTVIHESRASAVTNFSPKPTWCQAPIIISAEQTADSEVKLQWTHQIGDQIACEYNVMRIDKALGVKISESLVETTSKNEVVLQLLDDGNYIFTVVPKIQDALGTPSKETEIKVNNDWDAPPRLTLMQIDGNAILLEWEAALGVESYQLIVQVDDSTSIFSIVNMAYKTYQTVDIPANSAMMSYTFAYQDGVIGKDGIKLKFELKGIRYSKDGTKKFTQTTTENFELKPANQ